MVKTSFLSEFEEKDENEDDEVVDIAIVDIAANEINLPTAAIEEKHQEHQLLSQ